MLSRLKVKASSPLLVGLLLLFGISSAAAESTTLAKVKAAGQLSCGVSDGLPGFSVVAPDGTWTGLDADFCRGVAAAVLDGKAMVQFVPVALSARFPTLRSGKIDVLARNTTWTLTREAALGVLFVGTLFFDTEAIMVDRLIGRTSLSSLDGARICFLRGTNSDASLSELMVRIGIQFAPIALDSMSQAEDELEAGRCEALSADRSGLTILRSMSPIPERFSIIPESIGKSPLGPAVRSQDVEWFAIVRSVYFLLLHAEEQGLTQAMLASSGPSPNDPALRLFLDSTREIGKSLGLNASWASDTISAIGNYGEMFERNLGSASPFKMERGLNRLWSDGGLLYAPPLR